MRAIWVMMLINALGFAIVFLVNFVLGRPVPFWWIVLCLFMAAAVFLKEVGVQIGKLIDDIQAKDRSS